MSTANCFSLRQMLVFDAGVLYTEKVVIIFEKFSGREVDCMDIVALSRLQFAVTTTYHFLFVPVTLGLSIFVALLETGYVLTGREQLKALAKFFGTVFLVNFGMGVVTGIVQEFHFGMNWSEYSRFMGDIFGAPLALEALSAFFLESTFFGLWVFGWNRLPAALHCLCIWIVAFASNLSAF